jgi:2-polyprenyl-6-methoxyphenol hydroxylase-like FAD-dependent oxidoreductase
MSYRFDVIVVGARCAGSPLATLLARQGLQVGLVERATFPRDILSTHIFQGPAIKFLRRLGVLERVLETGARGVDRINGRQEDFHYHLDVTPRPGDAGTFMSVRRFVLDPILLDAAEAAGVQAMMGTTVTDLVRDGHRVTGVRVRGQGGERELHARLVVGADGRNSTVGQLAGARKYNVVPSERFGYWGFFAGAAPAEELVYHRWESRFIIAMPADGGLYQVITFPDMSFLPEFKQDRQAAFMAHARACAPVAEVIGGAQLEGKLLGMLKFESFFREAAGAGWALAGDAGNFKDPAPGQGISDAFRQVEALAPIIAGAFDRPDAELDEALAAWGRWRDRDAAEHYWMAADFGAAGPAPTVTVEMLRLLDSRGRLGELGDVLQHRTLPSKVFTPPRLVAATARMLRRPDIDRRAALREVKELGATDRRRRRLARHPEFADAASHADAGETEIPEMAAV